MVGRPEVKGRPNEEACSVLSYELISQILVQGDTKFTECRTSIGRF